MNPQISRTIARIKALAEGGAVLVTYKASVEIQELELGLDESDVRDVLCHLTAVDFRDRIRSKMRNEWLYVFEPVVGGQPLYLKVAVRNSCIVISFHEDSTEEEIHYGEEE